MTELAGRPDFCWVATAPNTNFPELTRELKCDVVIVGAGIVGLTAALSLLAAVKSVVVLKPAESAGR
jgi:ribulose 1,5-bisphosphate synthetase/thiazole synthase